ncbi:uncharacterized protein LOC117111276 [Anneissia japonica]|uniref:uncharacterized protein LOC117111276 n=1 Tax=Anneissia japonica TaxID=1529436 RepID=UPI001425697A|nr:uncharacterized protein LOC117111276 [Anneissia japonica]
MRKEEDDQPHTEYVLDLSEELDECKVILTLKENPKDFVRSIVSYYADHGLDLKEIVEESVVFHLSTHDPDSLMHLWELHSSGTLIENLAEILVPEIHQQEFLDEWMTYIDENEYEAALSKLKEEEIMETLQQFTKENWNAGCLILMIMTISSLIYLYQETVTIEFMLITTVALYNLRGEERGFNIFVLFLIIFIYSTYFKFFFVADNPYNYYYKKFIEFILIIAIFVFIHAFRIGLLSSITSKIAKYICNCTIVIISLYLIYHFSFTIFYVKLWLIYFLDICYTTYILDIVVGIDE